MSASSPTAQCACGKPRSTNYDSGVDVDCPPGITVRTGRALLLSGLVEAGGKSIQDHLPDALHYSINNESLVIANRNGMHGIQLVILPVRVAGGILQQLLDALVDQSPRVFGEIGVLFLASSPPCFSP